MDRSGTKSPSIRPKDKSFSTAGPQLLQGSCFSSSSASVVMPRVFTACSSGASASDTAIPASLVQPTRRLPGALTRPLWLGRPSVEPSYCSVGARVLLHGMMFLRSFQSFTLKNLPNLLVVPEMKILYLPIPTSTANSKRAPAHDPAPSTVAAAKFPHDDGSACHGLALRMEAVTMKTLCWMICLVPRKRFALLHGRVLVKAVLAVRLMSLLPLGARKALR